MISRRRRTGAQGGAPARRARPVHGSAAAREGGPVGVPVDAAEAGSAGEWLHRHERAVSDLTSQHVQVVLDVDKLNPIKAGRAAATTRSRAKNALHQPGNVDSAQLGPNVGSRRLRLAASALLGRLRRAGSRRQLTGTASARDRCDDPAGPPSAFDTSSRHFGGKYGGGRAARRRPCPVHLLDPRPPGDASRAGVRRPGVLADLAVQVLAVDQLQPPAEQTREDDSLSREPFVLFRRCRAYQIRCAAHVRPRPRLRARPVRRRRTRLRRGRSPPSTSGR